MPRRFEKPGNQRTRPAKQRLDFQQLETRSLLAGIVTVGFHEGNLYIRGDGQANQISIDLDATEPSQLVNGLNDTQINLWGSLNTAGRFKRVGIKMGDANDQVILDGSSSLVTEDLYVSMEDGDDQLTIISDTDARLMVREDLTVSGGSGSDSVFAANTYIRDNLLVTGDNGPDKLVLENVQVKSHATIRGNEGNDTILVSQSRFGSNLGLRGSLNDDLLGVESTVISGRLGCYGDENFDTLYTGMNYSNFPVSTFEFESSRETPNAKGEAEAAIRPAFDLLLEHQSELSQVVADQYHDALNSFASEFNVSLIQLALDPASQTVSVNDPTPSVSVLWDHAVQSAVENTGPGPTIASRAYAMMHTAMYDAWSAYDATAVSTLLGDTLQQDEAQNTDENKLEAMSFAAYLVLEDLFASQIDVFDDLMSELGFDPSQIASNPNAPSAIGKSMADAILAFRHEDGSNQLGEDPNGDGSAYSDTSGYQPVNQPGNLVSIDAWAPEFVPIDAEPGPEERIQQFLTPHWGQVQSFSLDSGDEFRPDAPQPFLLVEGTVDLNARTITLPTGEVLPIDRSQIGTVINPEFISQAEEVVEFSANLTDEHKLIAEFWEDGGGTSFPPGTFMTFGQFVSARDNHSLDDDAKMFFALGNATFDAGIATWEAKVAYDYARPVRAVRELGRLGLIGQYDEILGGFAIEAWVPDRGTETILATDFLTYQTPGSDPSPPFAEYTSGHSAFSAAAATVLEFFTGSEQFGASVTFDEGVSRFEPGETPASPVTLSWETFRQAADEAGLSRLYGGIHFAEGDLNGRQLGVEVGTSVWETAQSYINGTRS